MKRNMNRAAFAVITLLLLLPFTALADRVDEFVRAHLAERHIPGAAIAVIQNGKIVKRGVHGVASLEHNVKVTTETVFEIGSVSKQMTAAGIMLLVEDGKVSLDEKISAYLPNAPDVWKDVTVRHLLTHTSGIKNYTGLTGFELSRRVTIDGFIKQLSEHPLEFTPGEKNIYSNSGYNLLAHIIQTRSGKSFMDFMRERVFLPLGMTKTGDRDPQFIIPLRATGYEWRNDRYTGRDGCLTDLMGAGSITSTITDMIKWEAALSGDKFLRPESKREMWTQFTFNNGEKSIYGFGWRIADVRGHKLIGHTGQTAGFGAAIFRYVDNGLTVIVLTNLGEIGLPGPLAARIAKEYVPSLSLRALKPVPDPDTARSDMFLDALRSRLENKPNEDLFSSAFFRALQTERSKASNNRLAAFGPIVNFTYIGDEIIDGRQNLRYLVQTGKRLFLWRFALDENGKIAEMTLEEEE
jgi:D-alanyl-D-alanine carboxypeptidase